MSHFSSRSNTVRRKRSTATFRGVRYFLVRRHHRHGRFRQCQRLRPSQGAFHTHLKSRDPEVNQQTRRPGRWARGFGQNVTLRNRFDALQEEENEEEVDWIQWCAEVKEGKTSGKEEIVVDSGAARPCFFLVLSGSLMLMMCAHCNVAQEKVLSRVAHFHFSLFCLFQEKSPNQTRRTPCNCHCSSGMQTQLKTKNERRCPQVGGCDDDGDCSRDRGLPVFVPCLHTSCNWKKRQLQDAHMLRRLVCFVFPFWRRARTAVFGQGVRRLAESPRQPSDFPGLASSR